VAAAGRGGAESKGAVRRLIGVPGPSPSSFPLDRAHEEGYFVSLLYYMGL
jgi:hypothetical protein